MCFLMKISIGAQGKDFHYIGSLVLNFHMPPTVKKKILVAWKLYQSGGPSFLIIDCGPPSRSPFLITAHTAPRAVKVERKKVLTGGHPGKKRERKEYWWPQKRLRDGWMSFHLPAPTINFYIFFLMSWQDGVEEPSTVHHCFKERTNLWTVKDFPLTTSSSHSSRAVKDKDKKRRPAQERVRLKRRVIRTRRTKDKNH